MQYQKKIKEIIQDLAIRNNMSFSRMEEICMSPLEFTEEVMHHKVDREKLYYPSVRIVGFGVFFVRPTKLSLIRMLNAKNGGSRWAKKVIKEKEANNEV